ncbi:hypothetical protein KFE25_001568 [Diacronema lutheri]|uniref:G-protein coupled receptors family 1 profile domain-containing protein n=1 Tax=Diacronema lutheri TaxID=2081491 RepID=A0A8J5X1D3_DIALT|nr:hypothetical protein KFE25_001568 [Diacronema lutheri]
MPYSPLTDVDGGAIARAARGQSAEWDRRTAAFMLIRVPVSDAASVHYWAAWVGVTVLSTVAISCVIVLILTRRRLRSSVYNHFIVGLAIPDLVFSLLCLGTCALHVAHGHWYDGGALWHGGWMCDFQAWYTVFGVAGSMWINVLITAEFFRVSTSVRRLHSYTPPSVRTIWRRLLAVYALVAVYAWVPTFGYRFWPELPMRAYAVRGLNCLPVPFDDTSSTVQLCYIYGMMAFLPFAIMLVLATFIYRPSPAADAGSASAGMPSRRASNKAPMRRARAGTVEDAHMRPSPRPSPRLSLREARPLAQLSATIGPAPAPSLDVVDERTSAALLVFFSRLFFIMAFCWAPFFLVWATQLPYDKAGAQWAWIAGSWAHMQGFFSSIIYVLKEDLRAELSVVLADASAWLTRWRGAAGEESDDMHALGRAKRDSGSLRRHARRYAQLTDDESAAAAIDMAAMSGDLEAAMAAVALDAEATIIAHERTPMLVVGWMAWLLSDEIPRHSRGIWRERKPTDTIIFISHRWWRTDAQRPDDDEHTKYHLITEGVRKLMAKHAIAESQVAIWIDYSCIDQDDTAQQRLGISSLITYAARSSFVLIPVEPTEEAMSALHAARHPIDLIDYGERAWCRCEIYVFVCLAEVTRRAVAVYGYGNADIAAAQPQRASDDESVRRSSASRVSRGSHALTSMFSPRKSVIARPSLRGSAPRASASPTPNATAASARPSRATAAAAASAAAAAAAASLHAGAGNALRALGLVTSAPRVQLRALLTTGSTFSRRTIGAGAYRRSGVRFALDEMPSSGEVTIEADRETICAIENDVRRWFVHSAVLAEKARFDLVAAERKQRVFALDGKQVDVQHVPLIAAVLTSSSKLTSLTCLSLQSNLLSSEAVHSLVAQIVLAEPMAALVELDLSHNVHIGAAGIEALASAAAHAHFNLEQLRLRGCELEPDAGAPLALLVGSARRLAQLDVRDNALDDGAVSAIIEASSQTALLVDGNPISARVFQLVALVQMRAAGITFDAHQPASSACTSAGSSRNSGSSWPGRHHVE